MNKVRLTRSLSALCLARQVESADARSTPIAPSCLARRRHSQIGMQSMVTGLSPGPSQSGRIRNEVEPTAGLPRRLEDLLCSPCPPSPHVASLITSPIPTSTLRSVLPHPHTIARITEARVFQLLAFTDGVDGARVKAWKWLAEQTVVAHCLARDLKHRYERSEPGADEQDELADRLKAALERLQDLDALGQRLRAIAQGHTPQAQDDTVWKLNRLSPARMPIEFLALLPPSATVIELAGNGITDVPDGAFERFGALQRLNLSDNHITTVHRQSWRGLEQLAELDLSSNAICTIDIASLSALGALKKLKLDGNDLSALPRLPKGLEQANFAANAITAVAPDHLEGLSRLQRLNLNSNRLETFRPPVTGLKALEVLCLGYNRLTQLDRALMRLVPHLSTLVLADNRLSEITRESMQGAPGYPSRLANLTLAGNAIDRIERGAWFGHTALKLLDLGGNRLTSLADIFPKTPTLMHINLSHNLLRAIDHDIFAGMPNLRKLDLSHNQIAEIAKRIFGAPTLVPPVELMHIKLDDNELERFSVELPRRGWIRVDLHNNRFTPEEAARLEASNRDDLGAAAVLRLTNFPDHERDFGRWLGAPMTRLLGALRYVTEVDTLYEFLHTVRRIGSHRGALPPPLRERRERILAALLDRVETLLPELIADPGHAGRYFQALKSGLAGCGDRAMFAWWLMEIECRKQRILQASPDRLQLVQLGVWLHRLEKLLQFAKVLSARSTGNAAEAVEIQLWLLEALHHLLLGELGRPMDTSIQILYKSAVLLHDDDLLDIQQQIAMAESADDYPQVLTGYLQTQPFWQMHLAGDPVWQSAVQGLADGLLQIEVEYRAASITLMESHDYDAGDPAYRAAQTELDTQRAKDISAVREDHARRMILPVRDSLQRLTERAEESSRRAHETDTGDALAQRHADGWQWLDNHINRLQTEWQDCQRTVEASVPQRGRRQRARSSADKLRDRLQRWKFLRAWLGKLHEMEMLPHPRNLSFDFSGLGLTEFPSELLGLLPEQTYFIKLSENAITTLPENAFSRFSRLEYLHLANNRLTIVDGGSLRGLRRLRLLDLSANHLVRIAPTAFQYLVALEECDARQNALVELPWLPRNVRSALFDHNKIVHVGPDALRGLHQLTQLRLQQNEITTLELPAGGLPALTDLNVSKNHLTVFDVPVHRMPKLLSLDLSQNRIKRILPIAFDRPGGRDLVLQKLNLAGNQLQSIEPHLFTPLQQLSHLELQGNRLTTLPRGCVSGMPALRHLNLAANQIAVLEAGTFAELPHLMTLELSGNHVKAIEDTAFCTAESALGASVSGLKIGLSHNQLARLPETIQWPVCQTLVDLRSNLFSASTIAEILSRPRQGVQLLVQNPSFETVNP